MLTNVTDSSWRELPATEPGAACHHPHHHQHGRYRRYVAGATGVLLAGAVGYIGLVDPHNTSSAYPQCPFKVITGWDCPFCGGLRMVNDLVHGNLVASINDNIVALIGLPLLAAWILTRRRRGRTTLPIPAVVGITVLLAAWTVVRNVPGFPLVPTLL
jgi:ABC-type Fe3+-siderophore transport system permease subunit